MGSRQALGITCRSGRARKRLGQDVTFRRYLVLAGVTVFGAAGDAMLSRGMKQVGNISLHHVSELILAILNLGVPWVFVLLLAFFAAYMTCFAGADLPSVLPATSL